MHSLWFRQDPVCGASDYINLIQMTAVEHVEKNRWNKPYIYLSSASSAATQTVDIEQKSPI